MWSWSDLSLTTLTFVSEAVDVKEHKVIKIFKEILRDWGWPLRWTFLDVKSVVLDYTSTVIILFIFCYWILNLLMLPCTFLVCLSIKTPGIMNTTRVKKVIFSAQICITLYPFSAPVSLRNSRRFASFRRFVSFRPRFSSFRWYFRLRFSSNRPSESTSPRAWVAWHYL